MKKSFIPLTRPTLPKVNALIKKLSDVIKSQMITEHKYVRMLEKKCALFLGVKHVFIVSSGTSALILTLKCLELTGEVIIPSFTYTSDGHALLWCGLKPVFVDIDKSTFNLDPLMIEKKITKKTSAIMPTHVFGNPCDIDKIKKIAQKYKLKIIYDAAHAFGAKYKGKSIAGFGDASTYSLTPTKVFTTGEGGLIATNDDVLANKLRIAKFNGDSFNREEEFLGMTSRMSEFQAIVGLENLKILKKTLARRLRLVDYYQKKLHDIDGITFQKIEKGTESVYKDLTVLIDEKRCGFSRDVLIEAFKKNNIQTKVYFDPPLHKKKVYKNYQKTDLSVTDDISSKIVNLPLYSHMSISEINRICDVIISLRNKKT